MKNQNPVEFRLVHIATEEFAKFEENYKENAEINEKFSLGFNIDEEARLVLWQFEILSDINKNILFKGKFNFSFEISENSWKNLKNKSEMVFPKNLLNHFAMLAVGTVRGILFEKLNQTQSKLSNYILPLINISEVIDEDVNVPLK